MLPTVLAAGPFTLRPPEPADVAWIYDSCQDPEIPRWTRVPSPYSAADAVAFLERSRQQWADDEAYPFVITLTDTGELLGACGVHSATDGRREIGYWLALEGRQRGVLVAVIPRLLQFCRETLGLDEVSAYVKDGNLASERVLDRAGFELVDRTSICTTPRGADLASFWVKRL